MKKYILKYSIILIIIIGLQGLLRTFVIIYSTRFLYHFGFEFNQAMHLTNIISLYIPYLLNIIIALIILSDLLRNKIKGFPVVLLSVLSYFAGTLLFLFLINNKINNNDKQ